MEGAERAMEDGMPEGYPLAASARLQHVHGQVCEPTTSTPYLQLEDASAGYTAEWGEVDE